MRVVRAATWMGVFIAFVAMAGACSSSGGAAPAASAPPSTARAASTEAPTGATEAPAASTEAPAASSGRGRGDYDYGTSSTEPEATASSATTADTVTVSVATTALGEVLAGPDGRTLYTFTPDSPGTSTCSGGCAESWPPLTVGRETELEAAAGVTGTLTTFAREDGSLQVAYDGAPLYYFANDTAPGDTNGEGLGNKWFVAKP